MEIAERPSRERGRLRAVSAPGPCRGVLKRPLRQHPGLPLAAAERILMTAAKSILENGSVNQKETSQCK